MASFEELQDVRKKKLALIKEKGICAYPAHTGATHTLQEVQDSFETLEKEEKEITLAGRIMAVRGQGAISFIVLHDGTNDFQAVLKQDEIDEEALYLFREVVDTGDFISVTGPVFVTKRGAQSLLVKSWAMLTKTLSPLPEKWHGLQDTEARFRKRYLDLLSNPEAREMFRKKSHFWRVVRNLMEERGFLEVETPTLEVTTGGAEANPFKTHHDDFDMDVFLRISVGELWQKRLMAGGFEKTYEIGRVYRNEGSSPEHTQEFTNMEFYWAYADYKDGMKLSQELYNEIAQKVFGKTEFTTRGHTFDLKGEWEVIEYVPTVEKMTGINVLDATEDEMKEKLTELGVSYEGDNKERLTDTLWKYCRKQISGPVFLIHHPKLVSPLSKECAHDSRITERFQIIIAGSEVGNGFSELNDPEEQRKRFELQEELIKRGDDEAMMPEWEFVEMLEHGMPPTFGFGFGERLFAFLVDMPIREVQLFPLMKPLSEKETPTDSEKEN
ncbi:MAG: lysyl-tRNA synthetase class 2 [Flavobacteriaceae bacterium]|jgi:lysyl-tRNA synthetase class 2